MIRLASWFGPTPPDGRCPFCVDGEDLSAGDPPCPVCGTGPDTPDPRLPVQGGAPW